MSSSCVIFEFVSLTDQIVIQSAYGLEFGDCRVTKDQTKVLCAKSQCLVQSFGNPIPKGTMSSESTITENGALFFAQHRASKRMELARKLRAAARSLRSAKSPPARRLTTRQQPLFGGVPFPQLGPLEQF
jgi:hypothetical protein